MVELILRMIAPPKGTTAMVQALATVMFQAKLETGCAGCQLYVETGNPRSLCYVEQWATATAMESQIRSSRFATLLAIMETASADPSLQIHTLSEPRGLEYVRMIRMTNAGSPDVRGNRDTRRQDN